MAWHGVEWSGVENLKKGALEGTRRQESIRREAPRTQKMAPKCPTKNRAPMWEGPQKAPRKEGLRGCGGVRPGTEGLEEECLSGEFYY